VLDADLIEPLDQEFLPHLEEVRRQGLVRDRVRGDARESAADAGHLLDEWLLHHGCRACLERRGRGVDRLREDRGCRLLDLFEEGLRLARGHGGEDLEGPHRRGL